MMTDQQPERLTLSLRRLTEDVCLVHATGELDMATAAEFTAALDHAQRSHPGRVVIDLLKVTFLGTVGLAALLRAIQNAGQHGVPAPIIVATQRAVLRPIQLAGLDQVLTIRDSVDEALTR